MAEGPNPSEPAILIHSRLCRDTAHMPKLFVIFRDSAIRVYIMI